MSLSRFVVRNFPYSETKKLQLKNSTNEKQDKVSIEGKMAGMGRGRGGCEREDKNIREGRV
jgi:hypothetical protein